MMTNDLNHQLRQTALTSLYQLFRKRPSRKRIQVRHNVASFERLETRTVFAVGALDLTFGDQGMVQADAGKTGFAEAVAVYPAVGTAHDGKVVAAGRAVANGTSFNSFAVRRFTLDGTADTAFGTDGLVTTAFSKNGSVANAVAVLPDGKVLAAGQATLTVGTTYDKAFALARYNPNGSLDTTFGGRAKGKVTTNFGAREDVVFAIAVQPDGKIVLAGTMTHKDGSRDLALARYTPEGALDPSFDGDGKATYRFDSGVAEFDVAVALQTDAVGGSKLVVAANAGGPVVARFHLDGRPDVSFGSSGRVSVPVVGGGVLTGMAVRPDGTIILGGQTLNAAVPNTNTYYDVFLSQLTPDGATDMSFDGDGMVYSDLGGGDRAEALTLQQDGKVVLVGHYSSIGSSDRYFLAARYDTTGQLDTTWNPSGLRPGVTVSDFSGPADEAWAVATQPDGKVVAAGRMYTGSADKFALTRYQTDATSALTAAAAPPARRVANLAAADIEAVYAEAVARWQAAGVDTSALDGVAVEIADLAGLALGEAGENTILLDTNAAGWGWYADATPEDDREFVRPGNQGEKHRIDLLTVLMHEMGHLLGVEHEEQGLMAESLARGKRYSPENMDEFFKQHQHRDGDAQEYAFPCPDGNDLFSQRKRRR